MQECVKASNDLKKMVRKCDKVRNDLKKFVRESEGLFKENGAKKKRVRFDLKKMVRKRKTSVNHLKIENMKVKCT